MGFPTSSSIFNGIRAPLVPDGLSDEQVGEIAGYIDRSAIFTRRIREFERAGGQIEYETAYKNYFWSNAGIATVYVSPAYKNTAGDAPNIDELTKVIAHEMSHFETYYQNGFNPNDAKDADAGAAAGCRDEARAYGLEYLIECQINESGPRVNWTEDQQASLARNAIAALPPETRTEAAMLEAATRSLLDWAANWTGPSVDAGGYFQFYKNDWLKSQQPPANPIAVRDVVMRCDSSGTVCELEYTQVPGSRRTVVLDAQTGMFVPKDCVTESDRFRSLTAAQGPL